MSQGGGSSQLSHRLFRGSPTRAFCPRHILPGQGRARALRKLSGGCSSSPLLSSLLLLAPPGSSWLLLQGFAPGVLQGSQ